MTNKSVKTETLLKPRSLFAFFFALACENIFIKPHSIENRCYKTGKYTVCRRIRASFSPEIVQAGAVKVLSACAWFKQSSFTVTPPHSYTYLCFYLLTCVFTHLIYLCVQVSYSLWRALMFAFWWVVIVYSMAVLIIIYTYQFEKFPGYWASTTGWDNTT